MDIWITWCNKTAKCKHCSKDINPGEPLVRGKLWKKHGQATKWSYKFYWHPECWVEQGIIELRARPRVSPFKGDVDYRIISPEDKAIRLKLLQKRANTIQRMRKAGIEQNLDLLIALQERLDWITVEIGKYGGAPAWWSAVPDSDQQQDRLSEEVTQVMERTLDSAPGEVEVEVQP